MTSTARLAGSACALLALVLFLPGARAADPATVQQLSNAVLKKTAWINEMSTCPAQVMQPRPSAASPAEVACMDDPTQACLARCESGAADACYWLGQGLMQAHALEIAVESLFQRACKLGNASACTNRASGLMRAGDKDKSAAACAVQTFEKTCAQDDPWGCTMFGFHLVRGVGTAPDPQRALQVMNRSCRLGDDDPACEGAKKLRAEAQDMLKAGAPKK